MNFGMQAGSLRDESGGTPELRRKRCTRILGSLAVLGGLLFGCAATIPFAVAADAQDQAFARLPPGKSVLGDPAPSRFELGGRGGALTHVPIAGQPFATALTQDGNTNRILLQAAFALGPHRPHPF